MATIKDLCKYNGFKRKCLFCGYDEYAIALTAHHVFPKKYFKPQPDFEREDRYIILCPTCHALVHRDICVGDGKQKIINIINLCSMKYQNMRNIDNIVKLAKMIYARVEEPKALYTTNNLI